MQFEPLLSFNDVGAYESMGKAFEAVITKLCDTVMESARANLGSDVFYAGATAELSAMLTDLAQSGLVSGKISSDHWTAWIAEWGSGSEMDVENPGLAVYMANDELWNKLREANGNAITGRAKGPYIGLDGEIHDAHTGVLAGRNLEQLRQYSWFTDWMASVGLPDDAFTPKVPLHFMRDALESNRNLIMDQLNAVIEVFSFGDFFM